MTTKRPATPHSRRVLQFYENINEEREDLCRNLEQIAGITETQVQILHQKYQSAISKQQALAAFLAKIVSLYSALNCLVSEFLETERPPFHVEANIPSSEEHSLNGSISSYEQVPVNGSYVLLSNIPNQNSYHKIQNIVDVPETFNDNISATTDSTLTLIGSENDRALTSTLGSNGSAFRTLSTYTQHGLDKLASPSENLTENLNCINEKVEFIANGQLDLINFESPTRSSKIIELREELVPKKLNRLYSIGRKSRKLSSKANGALEKVYNDVYEELNDEFDKVEENLELRPINIKSHIVSSETNDVPEKVHGKVPKEELNDEVSEDSIGIKSLIASNEKNDVLEKVYDKLPKIAETNNLPENSILLQEELNDEVPENLNHLDSIGIKSLIASNEKNDVLEKVYDKLPKIPETNNVPENSILLPMGLNGPSSSTGAIRKRTSAPELYLEPFHTGTMSQKERCQQVNSWLENKTESLKNIQSDSTYVADVVEKLHQVKRYDRHEAVMEEAKTTMPIIKFVPYVPPQLESDGSSSGKSRKSKSKLRRLDKDFEIPQMEPPVEGSVCIFSHIVSPQEFYVQLINPESTSNLDLICESLNESGQTKKGFVSKQVARWVLEKYCYGYISGKNKSGQWFRLQILNWQLEASNDEVIVQSIDYGFTTSISCKCLRELTLNLASIPRLAIKCHFVSVYPIGSTPTNLLSDWPKSTIDILYDLANINKDPLDPVPVEDVTLFEIIFAFQMGDSLAVDLISVPVDGGDSMGRELIEMGLAKEIMDIEEDPNLAEMLQDVDELEAADNLNEYILGYDARDEARVCKFATEDGTCYKGTNCKLEHIQLKDGYTTDKCPTYYKTSKDLILPQKQEEIEVLVTSYIDSCTYTVQMVRNRVHLENNVIVDKDLADLVKNINDPKLIGTYVPFKMLPAIGELILAYNSIAKKWMRAVVRDFEDLDPVFIEVSPIDYGGDFKISIKNIRKMKEEFMHLPCQTFQIYLDNYQHKESCDNMKANKFFEKHIYYKTFIARILTHELPFKVKLMTLKGRDIGDTLVREGFAEPRTVDRYLSEDRNLRGNLILD